MHKLTPEQLINSLTEYNRTHISSSRSKSSKYPKQTQQHHKTISSKQKRNKSNNQFSNVSQMLQMPKQFQDKKYLQPTRQHHKIYPSKQIRPGKLVKIVNQSVSDSQESSMLRQRAKFQKVQVFQSKQQDSSPSKFPQLHRKSKRKIYKCPLCDYSNWSYRTYDHLKKKHHKQRSQFCFLKCVPHKNRGISKNYLCTDCGNKFCRIDSLKRHKLTCKKKFKNNQCPECCRRYVSQCNLKNHKCKYH